MHVLRARARVAIWHASDTLMSSWAEVPAPLLPDADRLTVCLGMDECLVHAKVANDSIKGCTRDQSQQPEPAAVPDFAFELPYLDAPVRVFKRPALDDFLIEAHKARATAALGSAGQPTCDCHACT